ncbi:hypothetical protein ANCDUO_08090 [Ancylostoma duodenale]|uniref:Uncharacterized protein n=1 Tax=Ancylostoma duodenale TaxID=51022 RepID=A0A0C2GK77_9BILA|nr:hypothetical protein ANCDUO_08090 [Ancylostoma duodenale]
MRPPLILILVLLVSVVNAGFLDFLSKLTGGSSNSNSGSSSSSKKKAPVSDEKAKKYLQDFGYVAPSNTLNAAPGMSGDLSDVTSLFKRAITRAIREGYEVWAAVTPLEFEEVPAGSGADIKVDVIICIWKITARG